MPLNAIHSHILTRLEAAATRFRRPVTANLRFFIAATLLGAITPLFFALSQGARIMWLMLFAATQSAAIAYLICLLATHITAAKARSLLKATYLSLIIVSAAVECGSIIFTGEAVGPDSLGLVIETNPSEIKGFASQYMSAIGLLTVAAIIIACLLVAATINFFIKKRPTQRGRLVVSVTLFATICFGAFREAQLLRGLFINDYRGFLLWVSQDPGNPVLIRTNQLKFADPLPKWTYLIKDRAMQQADIGRWEETQQDVLENPAKPSSPHDFNIVVIIGESFIQSHSSLYGYTLPTNPRLGSENERGNLVAYTDIISTANFTTTSLRNMLNLNDLSQGEQWWSAPYFPLLLKQAGWQTCHFDNQTISSSSDIGLARMIYSPINIRHTYDGVSDSIFKYDGEFAGHAARKLAALPATGKKFVTYHLWGQHFDCRNRFPGTPRFTAKDITVSRPWLEDSHRQEIADYDSATYYNDSVVGAIIDYWRDTPTLLFYFSDHGEDCWDLAPMGARNHPRPDDRAWLDRQYRVPFFVWMSDPFKDCHPDLVKKITASRDRSGMLDNFGQMVLGLGEVTTPYYRPRRDITSPDYQFMPRVTSEGYRFD